MMLTLWTYDVYNQGVGSGCLNRGLVYPKGRNTTVHTIGRTQLIVALVDVGKALDRARDPAAMKRLITQRKQITARLEALKPAELRIFRGA